jgi:hypothetical protein
MARKEPHGDLKMAGADWFSGTCEGEPLDVSPPALEDLGSEGCDLDEEEYFN